MPKMQIRLTAARELLKKKPKGGEATVWKTRS